ncbi:hypothetical protein AUG19_06355 [archaeon 13_1_20CM_2_54_9]|nr:MAG: hypothetical protein AUJ07_07370 [Crenarchaeota archaeon 13_1_40CM_3_53_5]OLE75182.1 MAG: hypothetical protein AUG19_06355 [archaeon 13_1_20CM_2_54_9]
MDKQGPDPSSKGRHRREEREITAYQSSSLTEQTRRFMQTLDGEVYGYLRNAARIRGVTVQGLIRAVIIPGYVGERRPKLLSTDDRSPSTHKVFGPLLAPSGQLSEELSMTSKQSPTRALVATHQSRST